MQTRASVRRRAGLVVGVALVASLTAVVAPASGSLAAVGLPSQPPGIDPQSWADDHPGSQEMLALTRLGRGVVVRRRCAADPFS